jgi:hypothetical protein
MNIPSLNQRLHSLEGRYEFLQKLKKDLKGEDKDKYKAIIDFVNLYEKQQKAGRPITDAEASQKVRLCLHEMFPDPRNGISTKSNRQEDASQGLLFLLRDVDFILKTLMHAVPPAPFFILEQIFIKENVIKKIVTNERQFEFHMAIELVPDSDGKLSFEKMLKNYFRNNEIVQTGKIIKKVGKIEERECRGPKWYYLQTPPPELLIPIGRFTQDPLTGDRTKNNNTIVVPEKFTMPEEYIRSGEAGNYELDAFIEHDGLTMSSGHYICYLKINKKWYRISDSDVEEISPANLKKKRDKAYIYHFTRV